MRVNRVAKDWTADKVRHEMRARAWNAVMGETMDNGHATESDRVMAADTLRASQERKGIEGKATAVAKYAAKRNVHWKARVSLVESTSARVAP